MSVSKIMPNPVGRQVVNTKTGEKGHVFWISSISANKEYWFRTCKANGSGLSGRLVLGNELKFQTN